MSIQNDGPDKAAIDQGVAEAHAAEGYTLDDGTIDKIRRQVRLYEVLAPRKVLTWEERNAKAMFRGDLVHEAFPNLPTPAQFADAEDPQLAEAVWGRIETAVTSDLRPSANGPVQQVTNRNMGNGYVLIRTAGIGNNRTPAFYITDNRRCIEEDYLKPDQLALTRKINALLANVEMVISRQPDNARRYGLGFERHLKALAVTSHGRATLAIESATAEDPDSDDVGGEGDEG